MKIICFAETQPGLGHLRRSSILAKAFQAAGDEVTFLLRKKQEHPWLQGLATQSLSQHQADIAIIDSYQNDIQKHITAKLYACFDDFCQKDPNFQVHIGPACSQSPQHQIIAPEFQPHARSTNSPELKNILITLGAFSTMEHIEPLITAIKTVIPKAEITVITEEDIQIPNTKTLSLPPSMGELFQACDLAISSAGQTLFELAATGTPTIAICHTENQAQNFAFIQKLGILNPIQNLDELPQVLEKLKDKSLRDEQTKASKAHFDFKGAERLLQLIKSHV